MGSALARDARTETYLDLEKMIYGIVHRFCRRFNVEFDEAICLANLAFCESFESYDSTRATFTTHCQIKILSKLYEWHRTTMRRHILGKLVHTELEYYPEPTGAFYFIDLMDELSGDARIVIWLTLKSPIDVIHAIEERGGRLTPFNIKNAVKEVLRDFHWDTKRIHAAFAEIGQAI